jgi:hypothetical protein
VNAPLILEKDGYNTRFVGAASGVTQTGRGNVVTFALSGSVTLYAGPFLQLTEFKLNTKK